MPTTSAPKTALASKRANASHTKSIAASKRAGAPTGITEPRYVRIEGFVEALVALQDDAEVLDRGARTLGHIRAQRIHNRNTMLKGGSVRVYEINATSLDRAERDLSIVMHERAMRLRGRIAPEVRRCAQISNGVAA